MANHTRGPRPRTPKSNIPETPEGQPFDLLKTLKCTRGLITARDAARLLGMSPKAVYDAMDAGIIPEMLTGLPRSRFIDPALWVKQLELQNRPLRQLRQLHAA